MAVYNKDGESLRTIYTKDGAAANSAYDKDGNRVYTNAFNIVVANYNVGGWYDGTGTNVPASKDADYFALQTEILQNIDADILCLEEYWDTFSQAGRTALSLLSNFYPYIETRDGTDQYFGHAICSKFPITSYSTDFYADDAQRYYDLAKINVYGTSLNVFVTHLNAHGTPNSRADEAAEIFNYIIGNNLSDFIVCGDFNVVVSDPLSEYNLNVFGLFLDDGCALANGGTFGVFDTYSRNSTFTDNLAVDNIIFAPAFILENVYTDKTKIGATGNNKIDHIPLVAEIHFGG